MVRKIEYLVRKIKLNFRLKDFKIILKMVNISAKKSNTSRTHSNEKYKKGGLVFPSYELYCVLKKINKNLSLFYTKTGEEYDYEPIFDSQYRHSDYFDKICKNINYNISVFKNIYKNDLRVGEFLYNNLLTDKFSFLFESIYYAFMEAMIGNYDFDNKKKNDKIRKIVSELSHCGVDPFKPQMV